MAGKVVAIAQQPKGGLLLTLEPHQVWAELDPSGGSFPVHVGDLVVVKAGVLGGFLMTGPSTGHRSIRVRRLQ